MVAGKMVYRMEVALLSGPMAVFMLAVGAWRMAHSNKKVYTIHLRIQVLQQPETQIYSDRKSTRLNSSHAQ